MHVMVYAFEVFVFGVLGFWVEAKGGEVEYLVVGIMRICRGFRCIADECGVQQACPG